MASCLCFSRPAAAGPEHGPQLVLDSAWYTVRDDTLAPFASTGPRFVLELGYIGKLGRAFLLGDVRFGGAYVVDRGGERGVTLNWGMHLSYLPIVYEGGWQVAVGPALGWDNDNFFFIEWDDAHAYWIGTLWLGPGVHAWRWLSERWRVDLGGELGLLGWQSRTPTGRRRKQETSENVFDTLIAPPTKDLEFGSMLDWQLARASVDFYYTHVRTDTPNGWGIGAELGLVRDADPVAFAINASLRLSYTWSVR